ncbi:uncharacterized protein IWZ02DRAFT_78559 [Phyllosticta citriasiana]|uniref:uncharacterized protein n=1 Tax=Phyllosticta citriasiana TaxID=595635 RepID=UPI0030FD71FA
MLQAVCLLPTRVHRFGARVGHVFFSFLPRRPAFRRSDGNHCRFEQGAELRGTRTLSKRAGTSALPNADVGAPEASSQGPPMSASSTRPLLAAQHQSLPLMIFTITLPSCFDLMFGLANPQLASANSLIIGRDFYGVPDSFVQDSGCSPYTVTQPRLAKSFSQPQVLCIRVLYICQFKLISMTFLLFMVLATALELTSQRSFIAALTNRRQRLALLNSIYSSVGGFCMSHRRVIDQRAQRALRADYTANRPSGTTQSRLFYFSLHEAVRSRGSSVCGDSLFYAAR